MGDQSKSLFIFLVICAQISWGQWSTVTLPYVENYAKNSKYVAGTSWGTEIIFAFSFYNYAIYDTSSGIWRDLTKKPQQMAIRAATANGHSYFFGGYTFTQSY